MRAAIVSVDYYDVAAVTVAANRHHFDEMLFVTTPNSLADISVGLENRCRVYKTNTFYEDGAVFAKWRALEEALAWFGRYGTICLMDADVLWPQVIPPLSEWFVAGCLYTPLRRMCLDPQNWIGEDGKLAIQESDWSRFPYHQQQVEWAGYTQIFSADDPVLQQTPWFDVRWKHAGGGDSELQNRWPATKKLRPPFECLHLGRSGKNWCGRATVMLDGTIPEKAAERSAQVRDFIARRGRGPDRFAHEKTDR